MGGFATAMMASSQDDLDCFTGAWQSMYLPGDNVRQPRAFGSSSAILYGLLVTGYMWDPNSATNPTLRPPPEPTAPVAASWRATVTSTTGLPEAAHWELPNGGPGAEGFAMHKDGEVHLLYPAQRSGYAVLFPVLSERQHRWRLSATA